MRSPTQAPRLEVRSAARTLLAAGLLAGSLAEFGVAQQADAAPAGKRPGLTKPIPPLPPPSPSVLPTTGSDDCALPEVIAGQGSFGFANASATTTGDGQNQAACNFSGQTNIDHDVWFAWTAPTVGTATITTCGGSSLDTKIAVYFGTACPTGAPVACNDDFCALQTSVSFAVFPGFQYVIQLGTYPGTPGGSGTFNITVAGGNAADDCSAPIHISGTGTFAFNTAGATTGIAGQADSNCTFFGTQGIGNDIWYEWTATHSGRVTLTTCGGTTLDTKIAVRYECGGVGGNLSAACNDDACMPSAYQSEVSWVSLAGYSTLIQLGSYPGAGTGSGTFVITQEDADNCTTPLALSVPYFGVYSFEGLTTGTQGQNEILCNSAGTSGITRDIWFTIVAPSTGIAVFDALQSLTSPDTKVAAYSGSGCPTAPALACNDNSYLSPEARLAWPVTAGAAYTIQFGTQPGAPLPSSIGQFAIDVDVEPQCYFQLALDSSQETPPTPSTATGKGCMVLDRTTHVLSYSIEFSGLSSAEILAHIHGFSPPGTASGILFTLPLGSPITGSVVLTASQETSFLQNLAYVNFHSALYGGGEIRGQILYVPREPPLDYCLGDGTATPCPCGNLPGIDLQRMGCPNSLGPLNGGRLQAAGVASAHCDSIVLTGSQMPNSSALYFQGTNWTNVNQGAVFGDGLRCVGGAQLRLATKTNISGSSKYPDVGDPPISQRGMIPVTGGTRYYQCWYRNAAAFCTAATFNLTQGIRVVWLY